MKIPNMIEKTLRYPGTIEYLRVLRETGFFSYEEVDIKGTKIRPIDLTAKLLFPKWKLKEGQEDFTVMRLTIKGEGKTIVYDLFDKYDNKTKTISMARTTGYTATAALNMLADGKFSRKGICPPEYIGENEECFNYILKYLKDRNVIYKIKE
jgi:saccharopine dehydrogenase-like NADP-dependent oxidoreductase